jgi:hypothetical protein
MDSFRSLRRRKTAVRTTSAARVGGDDAGATAEGTTHQAPRRGRQSIVEPESLVNHGLG